MNNQEVFNKEQLSARVSFLTELVSEKTNQLTQLFESLKRIEGHSTGSKELSEKIGSYIKKQQSELEALSSQQKLSADIARFVEGVLEGTRTYVRAVCSDVEKIYFSKQGELLFLQQEIEKLSILKLQYEKQISVLLEAEEAEKQTPENPTDEDDKGTKKEKPKKIRPDKDPNTRIGRAALDIAERKRKYKKQSP